MNRVLKKSGMTIIVLPFNLISHSDMLADHYGTRQNWPTLLSRLFQVAVSPATQMGKFHCP